MMIYSAVNSTLSMLMLILMGFFMGRTEYMQANHGSETVTCILTRWALPCYMFYNVVSSFENRSEMIEILKNFPVPFLLIGMFLLLGWFLSRLFKIRSGRVGVFINAAGFSNTVLLGFPVVSSLFGADIIPVAMIYYMSNTILFYTIGVWLLNRDAGSTQLLFSERGMKPLFSPPIIGLLFGIFTKLLEIPMPQFALSFLSTVSALCPCLGMLFIGMTIQNEAVSKEYIFPDILILFVVRYVLAPLAVGVILSVIPLENKVKAVYYILAMMPAMTQLGVMSNALKSDCSFASLWVTVSSTLGMVFLPIITLLLEHVWHFVGP